MTDSGLVKKVWSVFIGIIAVGHHVYCCLLVLPQKKIHWIFGGKPRSLFRDNLKLIIGKRDNYIYRPL